MDRPSQPPDALPTDPRERIDARIDAILRRLDPRDGDMGTLARRHAASKLLRLMRTAVLIDVQREVERAQRNLRASAEKQRADERAIRAQHQALSYYADPLTWQNGCAIHVHAFNLDVQWLDEGEHARETLRSVSWAFPR